MTELLVGSKKGLFVLRGEPGDAFEVAHRAFAGDVVEFALRDPRSGRYFASVTSGFYGPRLYFADDPAGEWQQANGPAFPEDIPDSTVTRIWVVQPAEEAGVLWAGAAPASLWRSEDDGESWDAQPAAVERAHQARVAAGRRRPRAPLDLPLARATPTASRSASRPRACGSATTAARAGAPATRGSTRCTSRRTRARARMRSASTTCGALRSLPSASSCSSTAACTAATTPARRGLDIASGLPSGFGFPLVVDAADPDSAYVIPLTADVDRVTPDGRCACTRRATPGRAGRPAQDGLAGRTTPTSRFSARPSTPTPARRRASTSAPRPATSSARRTAARPGSPPRRASRP